jgi:hypothetical protein
MPWEAVAINILYRIDIISLVIIYYSHCGIYFQSATGGKTTLW